MRIWSRKAGFSEWYKFVNTYMERDKKKYEKMDFCSYPPAHLVDFFTAENAD